MISPGTRSTRARWHHEKQGGIMGARGPAEGLRQGPREALVQLMAAAAQRQPWRGLNRWRYVGDPARPIGLRDRTSERFNCDDHAYLAPWENDCTIQTLHFLPPYYRGMQTGEVEREREREREREERRGPRKVQVEERRDPLSASRPLRALRYVRMDASTRRTRVR
jgi:hypothetical protein